MTPPLPVVKDAMNFYMFIHPNGRFSHAVKMNGVQVYARDYKQYAGAALPEVAPIEPPDSEYATAMGW